MNTIDLKCSRSFSFPPRSIIPLRNKDTLALGGGYQTFLYQEIPPCIGLRSLRQASLILFKIPESDGEHWPECPCKRYFAYPLLDYFSVYGYLYSPPHIDENLGAVFHNDPRRCVMEIDITLIVNSWLEGAVENKGLLLTGNEETCRITCASGQNEIAGMRPMIRLVCEDVTACQPLSVRDCTVSVDT